MHEIRASARFGMAITATRDLLERLRIEGMFAGSVARAAWLGEEASSGSIDVIALMTHQQKNQLAMMASNRGFRIEREEIDQSEELDLVPLYYVHAEGDVRVFVLLATNALYGRMARAAVTARFGADELRLPRAEDYALLLLMGEDREGLRRVMSDPEFDRGEFQARLVSIGVGTEAVNE